MTSSPARPAAVKKTRQLPAEVSHLKACVNDLIAILAMPAMWSGGESRKIVSTMLDVLSGMLRLDFVYAALKDPYSDTPFDMIRLGRQSSTAEAEAVGRTLNSLLTVDPQAWPSALQASTGDPDLALASFRLGLKNEVGVLVAGSRRADFPTPIERLLLNVAANQAAIGLHEARLLREQRLVAEKLDHLVTERTEDLDRFFDVSLDLLCVVDQHGHFRRLNEAWERALGYDRSELLARPFMEFVHPEDVDKTREAYADLIARKTVIDFVNRYRCKDGTYRWLEWSAAPGTRLMYGAARDITDRKQAEESMRQAQARLARATQLALAAELSASIAHELNQPLAAVVTNAHAALRGLSSNPPDLCSVQGAIERIVRDGKDAGDVVQRTRSLFRGAVPQMIVLDMNELITEVISLVEGEAARRQITVDSDLEENLPPTSGDRVQLQQVIVNLLLNGIEAMDTVRDRRRQILICSRLHQLNSILVEIKDNGPGIEDTERIFEPFFTTKEAGMGMGLAISRSIVEAHHGRLWAESGKGVGTTLCFTVPLEAGDAKCIDCIERHFDPPAPKRSMRPRVQPHATKLVVTRDRAIVYVVDDDFRIRESLHSLLTCAGFEVATFGSAAEFLDAEKPGCPGCLVLDLKLPGTNGLELQQQLAGVNALPIVFISGHGDISSSVRAMKAGAIEFLAKPFGEDELIKAIGVAISHDFEARAKRTDMAELQGHYALLTSREREVLPFVVAGRLAKQTAAELGTSEITIRVHRRQIMRKMQAHSLAELVRMADKLGIARAAPKS